MVPLEESAGRSKPEASSGGSLRPRENPLYHSGNTAHPHFLSQIHQLSPIPFSTTSLIGLRTLSSIQVQMFRDYRSEINCPPNFKTRAREQTLGFPSILGRSGTSEMTFREEGLEEQELRVPRISTPFSVPLLSLMHHPFTSHWRRLSDSICTWRHTGRPSPRTKLSQTRFVRI